jgi:quercetin dioxygenase-like cupin family protein
VVPAFIARDEQRTVSLYDVRFNYAIEGGRSDEGLAVLEVTIPPRTLVKPHRHSREDEFTYVVSGQVGCRLGDTVVEVIAAGSSLIKPRSVPHAMWNVTDEPARILEIITPAGLEKYFEELAPVLREHGPEWTARYAELTERFGLAILDDWTDELQERYGVKL